MDAPLRNFRSKYWTWAVTTESAYKPALIVRPRCANRLLVDAELFLESISRLGRDAVIAVPPTAEKSSFLTCDHCIDRQPFRQSVNAMFFMTAGIQRLLNIAAENPAAFVIGIGYPTERGGCFGYETRLGRS